MFTFTFPDGDTWNATVYPLLNGNVVLENFRIVSINDGTLRMSLGSFVPTNRVSVSRDDRTTRCGNHPADLVRALEDILFNNS